MKKLLTVFYLYLGCTIYSEEHTRIGVNAGVAFNSAWSSNLPVTDPVITIPAGLSFILVQNNNVSFLIDAEYFRKGSMTHDSLLGRFGYRVIINDSSISANWAKYSYDYLQFDFGIRLTTTTERSYSVGVEVQPYFSWYLAGSESYGFNKISIQNGIRTNLPVFGRYRIDLGAQAAIVFGALIIHRWAWIKAGIYSSCTSVDPPSEYIHRGFLAQLTYEFIAF